VDAKTSRLRFHKLRKEKLLHVKPINFFNNYCGSELFQNRMTSNTTTVAKNTARNINSVTFDDVPERLVFAAASCNVRKAETLYWGKAVGQMF
jgi:hypothetical protein